jgi:hemerythrin superfamily protein
MLVIDLIARDHRTIQRLFFELEEARPPAREPLQRLLDELDVHARAEEDVFYTAVRTVSRRIDDSEAGHEHMRTLMGKVASMEPGSAGFAEAVLHLKQTVLAHALEEEGGVCMDAQRLGIAELERLAVAMEEQKAALRGSQRRAA